MGKPHTTYPSCGIKFLGPCGGNFIILSWENFMKCTPSVGLFFGGPCNGNGGDPLSGQNEKKAQDDPPVGRATLQWD